MVTSAWLFNCSASLSIAVAEHEMVEYVQTTVQFPIPGAPAYCANVLSWQNNLVPIFDLITVQGEANEIDNKLLCIVAYQQADGESLQHAAICVDRPPEKILVDDGQACELPEAIENSVLLPVTLSCFKHGENTVLILDMAKLLSADFRELVNAV